MEDQQQSVLFSLGVDDMAQSHFISIAKWNRFMAIVGIVLSCLAIVTTIFGNGFFGFSVFGSRSSLGVSAFESGYVLGFIFISLVFIALFLIPCFFRLSFSNKMLKAIEATDQQLFNESLAKFKLYSKYWGILTIIGVSIYALIFVIAILIGFTR